MEQNMADWKINPDLVSVKNAKQFFSYDFRQRVRPKRPNLNVDFSSVYHSLPIQNVEDIDSKSTKRAHFHHH